MNLRAWVLIALAAVAVVFADIWLKTWANQGGTWRDWRVWMAIALWAVNGACWIFIFKTADLSRSTAVSAMMYLTVTALVGHYRFGEGLTIINWAGMVMAVAAIGLVSWAR